MSSKCEIKLEECATYERRLQIAQLRYQAAKERATMARRNERAAWKAQTAAKADMNYEFNNLDAAKKSRIHELRCEYDDEIKKTQDYYDSIRDEADTEHYKAKESRAQASISYKRGDRSFASILSDEAHKHEVLRDSLNRKASEVKAKLDEIMRTIRVEASEVDASAFLEAKIKFEKAKVDWELAKAELDLFKELRRTYEDALDDVKAERIGNKLSREEILDKVGLEGFKREDAKTVGKADGSTDVYYDGIGGGDGPGHGHATLNKSGEKIFNRDAIT